MKKTKSIVVVIMVIIATAIGFTACKNKCEKDGKCEKTEKCDKKNGTMSMHDSTMTMNMGDSTMNMNADSKKMDCCKKGSKKN